MGSVGISYTFEGTVEQLRADFLAKCDQDAWEKGHGPYSGSMGTAGSLTVQEHKRFTDVQTAEEYVDGLGRWKNDYVAVRLSLPAKPYRVARAAEFEKLQRAVQSLGIEIYQEPKRVLAAVKAAKTAKRGCGTCTGVVPVKYLRSLDCPICGTAMFCVSNTERKRLDSLNAKLVATRERLDRSEREFNDAARDRIESWYVSGRASS